MEKQTAAEALKESIRLLEIRQEQEGEELKAQFKATYESLKLVNIVKSSIKDITESVEIKNSLFESIVSVLSGYVTKKLMISSKSNPFMKIVGLVLQFGVTNLVAKNAEVIRAYITELIDKFMHPKEEEEEVPETEV
jgi:Arc/MetJ-type ribon-helix-helix transcriptional regulator